MSIRQLHEVFPMISLISLILGSFTGYMLIFIYDLAIYGFMMAYAVKYLVEIISFGIILWGQGRTFNIQKSRTLSRSPCRIILRI
jgi:hypothetical protein